jgi:DUF438 domain-containing protein
MNKDIQKIAKTAGFCFWENEEWKPDGEIIDWSSNYDNELEKFANLLINEKQNEINKLTLELSIAKAQIDIYKGVLNVK